MIVAGAFAHDLMRETLYLGIGLNRRAALHRQVAEHLQGGGPAELARHWSLASGEDARMHAAELALVAGDMAVAGWPTSRPSALPDGARAGRRRA